MTLAAFLEKLADDQQEIDFQETIAVIEQYYDYTPAAFTNGDVENQAGDNEGSCKILAFAQLNELTPAQTLRCFGQYYRDVLQQPDGNDHQNIRQFMQHGWDGVAFNTMPLQSK